MSSKLTFLSLTTSLLFPMHMHGHEKEQFPYVNDTQFIVVCQNICKNGIPLTLEYILELSFTIWSEGEMHKGPCYEMLFGDVNIANIRFFLATSSTYWLRILFLMNLCLYINVIYTR